MAHAIYVLILAGGKGARFWPLSRRSKPKQLLKLFSSKSLLEGTLDRLKGLVPPEQILILTNRDQEASVRKICKRIPTENIIAEPVTRDTAAAVALGAAWISLRDQAASMVVLPADHLIGDKKTFQLDIKAAAVAAQQASALVTIGVKPTWACPSFGYIQQGQRVNFRGMDGGPPLYEVERFREKPNPDLAETFLKEGNFRWNTGIFVWSIPSIMTELNRHTPKLASFVMRIHETENMQEVIEKNFPRLPEISVDYAIMEKANRVLVLEAGFDWDDVGTWKAVAKYCPRDEQGNAANTALTAVRADDNIVFSDPKKHVALVGVQDLIVIQTRDALLVAHRHEAERIKALVAKLPPELQ